MFIKVSKPIVPLPIFSCLSLWLPKIFLLSLICIHLILSIPIILSNKSKKITKKAKRKINGKKAYELARTGKSVDLKPKQIEIYDLKVLKQIEKNKFLLEVHCSSGTYIRSLCRDIASSLGTFGVMQDILRTKCGSFDIKKSFTIEDIEQGKYKIIPLDTVFDYEKLITYEADKLLNGQLINTDYQYGFYRIYTDNSLFLGIGNVKNKRLKLDMRLI